MLDLYSSRSDLGLGRLSAGFLGAGLIYGGLLAFFLFQETSQAQAKEPEAIAIVFTPPPAPAPPAAAPPLGVSKPTPEVKTKVVPTKPDVAPKNIPKDAPESKTEPMPEPSAANAVDIPSDLFGEGSPNGVPGGIPGATGTDPNGVPNGIPCGGPGQVSCGIPGGTGIDLLPDHGGPIPLNPGMDQPEKLAGQCPPPVYPSAARESSISGTVILRITITRDGKVKKPIVLDGPEIFQQAAIDSEKNCRYTPAKFNGHPIAVTKTVNIKFTLR